MPKPEEPKKKRKPLTFFGLPAWILIILIVMLMVPFFSQCMGSGGIPGL